MILVLLLLLSSVMEDLLWLYQDKLLVVLCILEKFSFF